MKEGHNVDNYVRLYLDSNGLIWVTHEELLNCGYRNIEDFDIVYLNERFYELQGYMRAVRSWWIEVVDTGEETETPYEPEAHEVAEGQQASIPDDVGGPGGSMRPLRKGTFIDPEARHGSQPSDHEDSWPVVHTL
jgi:PAS domain-containing protein